MGAVPRGDNEQVQMGHLHVVGEQYVGLQATLQGIAPGGRCLGSFCLGRAEAMVEGGGGGTGAEGVGGESKAGGRGTVDKRRK